MHNDKIIVILGTTSSGKSEVAIRLAKKFNGEVISADSRQIYKDMDLGTGKIVRDKNPKSEIRNPKQIQNSKFKIYYSSSIPHHMIDIVSPKTDYNAAKFKKAADKIIVDILKRGKLPIICGGTGFWIKALVDNVSFPEVKPDWKLRKKLEKKSAFQLFKELEKLDSERAKNVDKNNKVRLIRAIEICKALGSVPNTKFQPPDTKYRFLQIGTAVPKEKLYKNIKKRLADRFKQGMIKEAADLRKKYKLSWKKIQSFGLGYFWIPLYLQDKLDKKELFEKIFQAEKDYAKRQATWFQKDKRIKWLKNYGEIKKKTTNWLKK